MTEAPKAEIRFYNTAATERRLLSKETATASGRWKTKRYGGYSDADFTLAGDQLFLTESDSAGGIQPIRENDRVRVVVIRADRTEQLRWSGKVRSVKRVKGNAGQPDNLQIQCTGVFADISEVPVNGRFISPYPVDVSQAFASFAFVEAVEAYPELVVDIANANVGVTTQAEDAFNKNLGSTLAGLSERFSGLVVYGCDEVSANLGDRVIDRLYLRNVSSLTDPTYTFDVPGGFNGALFDMADGGKDVIRLANILTITGTDPLYPNYLGEACNGNCGFERPVFGDSVTSGLLTDDSFEQVILASWSLSGGATRKVGSIEGIPARTGDRYIELDGVGEAVTRTITTTLTAGQSLVVGIHARRETSATGGSIRIRVQFKNGGADVGAAQDLTFSPETVYWQPYSHQVTVPSGTLTGFEFSYTATVIPGATGINIDDAFAYLAFLRQDGWNLVVEGTAVRNSRDFAHFADKTQGRYSVKIDVTASDSDGNDAYFTTQGKFRVTPGAVIEFGCDIRAWDGTTNGKLRLDLRFYKADGSEVSGSGDLLDFGAGTINSTWRQIANAATVPNDAALCQVRVTFRGNSQVYLDRMYVRDTAAPTVNGEREWIDAGPYRIQIDTDDDAFISKPYHDSIATYGRRYEQIQSDAVVDRATAYAVAQGYFDTYALPLARPQVKIQDIDITFQCGQTVRLAGSAGQWLSGEPNPGEPSRAFPIAEIEESVDSAGKITTLLSLEIEPPSDVATISRIFDKRRRATTGGGVASLAGSPVGGGSGTSQSLSLPVSVANGGTAATTAGDARTNLGLGSTINGTFALYGPTTPGSMTIVNGQITAITEAV